MNSAQKILSVLMLFLAITAGSLLMYRILAGNSQEPAYATVWPSPKALPGFSLVDHDGNPFTNETLRGRWHLVFFGFTHCPDICPATLQQLVIANRQIEEAGNDVPEIVLVSVDPERDTPDVMKAYVGHFGGRIRGVTGDPDEILIFTSAAGIFFRKSELPDGNYTVDHSAAVLVTDPDGAIHASFSAPHVVSNFVHDIPVLTGVR